jgi:hypothetical protein
MIRIDNLQAIDVMIFLINYLDRYFLAYNFEICSVSILARNIYESTITGLMLRLKITEFDEP